MRNRIVLVAAILLSMESSQAQEPVSTIQTPAVASNSELKLMDATPVLLRTKVNISSSNAKVGDRVPFRVTEDVSLGGLVVIHRGAEAWGVVTAVKPKARKGRAGGFDIAIQTVQLLNGDNAALRSDMHSKGFGKSSAESGLQVAQLGVATMGLGLPLAPLLLLEKGQDAYLPANAKITAYLNGDVPLDRTALERVQPHPVAQRTGPATITVFRGEYWTGYSPALYCGKIRLGWLSHGSYIKFEVPPGKYFFDSDSRQVFELTVQEGQEVFLEMKGQVHGLGVRWHFMQVSNGEGEDELLGFRPSNPKNITKISSVSLADLQALPTKR